MARDSGGTRRGSCCTAPYLRVGSLGLRWRTKSTRRPKCQSRWPNQCTVHAVRPLPLCIDLAATVAHAGAPASMGVRLAVAVAMGKEARGAATAVRAAMPAGRGGAVAPEAHWSKR